MLPLSRQSPWSEAQAVEFLDEFRAPLRLSVNTPSGYPLLLSLWFVHEDGRLLCATRGGARVVSLLETDDRCAFELAPNEPPYYGVRGRGRARIDRAGADELLGRLIDRFLGTRESGLARWLLSRASEEVMIAIEPEWVTCWDYRGRMSGCAEDSA